MLRSVQLLTDQQISDAISALDTSTSDTQTIFIEEGTYTEQVYIPELSGKLIIYGQTEECVHRVRQVHRANQNDSDTTYSSNTVTIIFGLSLEEVSDDDESGKDHIDRIHQVYPLTAV